ncbi:GNAT family N-acetyltransferase [Streptomyces sp. NPDC050504]|uniref:GNAT family N-acetyltransferase n=1 Tax=Streptomyces sp. NPDC050504 TaxID=3365618 RepID=UPI0037B76060
MIQMRLAVPSDAPLLASLYDTAARWMAGRGIVQWKPGGKDAAHFLRWMAQGEVWLGEEARGRERRVIGAYELWWDDEPAWGPQPPVAGYVHRLMTDRAHAPAGAGRTLLAHAESRVAARGRRLARLDCLSSNPRLRAYYEALGYAVVGEEPHKEDPGGGAGYGVTLLEKPLPPAPSPRPSS